MASSTNTDFLPPPEPPRLRLTVTIYRWQRDTLDSLAKARRLGREGRNHLLRHILDEALEKHRAALGIDKNNRK